MNFKTKTIIATLILLFISGSGFLAGFIQESFAAPANSLKEEAADLKDKLDRIEAKALFLMELNIDRTFESMDSRFEAELLDNEFDALNNSLTPEEREVYVRQIILYLIKAQGIQNMIISIHLYRHFNQTQNDYVIATEENEGYDYAIKWDMWQSYTNQNGLPVYIWNASEYYGGYFSYSAIQALDEEFRPLDPETEKEVFIFEAGAIESVVDHFFLSQVRALQDQINSNLDEASILEIQAERISLAVSLTTVGVILSTAMVNRLYHKKVEHELAILKEKEGRPAEKTRDLVSIPVLIIATVLSIIGVVFPLILNLIGV